MKTLTLWGITIYLCFSVTMLSAEEIILPSEAEIDALLAEIPEEQKEAIEENQKELLKPGSSVNISQEYGFSANQNIDSFLGDIENPAKPLMDDQSYEGSRSLVPKINQNIRRNSNNLEP
jgi:hypothetical protein